jgi:Tfp pilus assembly protein PilN
VKLRPRIGIEIGPHRLRAVRIGGARSGRIDSMEVEWSSDAPAETVSALRERFGPGALLSVAVDTAALLVKRVTLPPLSLEERRRILTIDPERYFPVRGEDLVVAVRDDDLAFAAPAAQFDRWVDALGALGAVERVEPAPVALVRYLAGRGGHDGIVVIAHPGDRQCAVVLAQGGSLRGVRRVFNRPGEMAEAVRTMGIAGGAVYLYPWRDDLAAELAADVGDATLERVPQPVGTTEPFACAVGAALGVDAGPEATFASPALARRQASRRRWRAAGAAISVVAASVVLFSAFGAYRERALRILDERIAERRAAAAEVQDLQEELAGLRRELGTLDQVEEGRADPLSALLALTRTLPGDAHVRGIHNAGDQWEVDGYARDAARLIPVLEESNAFAEVRFRTATTRARVGTENYETFSLALRYLPTP